MPFAASSSVSQTSADTVTVQDISDYTIRPKSDFGSRKLYLYKTDGSEITFTGSPDFSYDAYPEDEITIRNLDRDYALRVVMQLEEAVGPQLVSASVENADAFTIVLTYDLTLQTGSLSAGKFEAVANDVHSNPNGASNTSGTHAYLTFGEAFLTGDDITITYTPGTSGSRIQDADGNFAPGFTAFNVVNNIS